MPDINWRERLEIWELKYLQELIDKYGGGHYQTIDDITPETVHYLLENILFKYQDYDFDNDRFDVIDVIQSYFCNKYRDDFPDTCYPLYPISDKRDSYLNILNHIRDYNLIPEDAYLLIDYLHTPENRIEQATKNMEEYFSQLDFKARSYKGNAAYQAIEQQRAEAEAKGEERPDRPSKRLMFEILTGKQAPEVVLDSGYIEKIISKDQKSLDYYAILIKDENSKDKEKLELKITPLLNDRQS